MAASLLSSKRPRITDNIMIFEKEKTDRLSSLHDDILIAILSLMDDPKEMVRTCVLSKRWLNLWTFIPCLNFNLFDFCQREKLYEPEAFENFVSCFLRHRDDATDLHTFTLIHRWMPCSVDWIHYALSHNLKILQLELRGLGLQDRFDLSDCFFTCDSLEMFELKFVDCDEEPEIIIPDNVFLPKLIHMIFYGVNMQGDSMKILLSGCPALEIVQLLYCVMNTKCISFQNVKQLELRECRFINELPSFSIFGPCLEYLEYTRFDGRPVEFKNMSNVKMALLSTFYLDRGNFSSFSCVEFLKINNVTMLKEKLQAELPNCPKFHNLKELILGMECFHCAFGVLCSFLKHCPNLEYLTLYQSGVHCKGDCLEKVEKFGCDRLRLVEVVNVNESYGFDLHKLIPLLTESTSKLDQIQILRRKSKKSS